MMSMRENVRRKEKKLGNNDMKNIMGKTSSCEVSVEWKNLYELDVCHILL